MMRVFDVDGVVLRSNAAKADAYRTAALQWGEAKAATVAEFQAQLGSMSRHDKWVRIFTDLLGVEPAGPQFDAAVEHCTRLIDEAVARCPEVPGVREFIGRHPDAIVVSGVRQPELGRVLAAHRFDHLPAYGGSKTVLLPELVADGTIRLPAVYYGDTRDDWHAALAAGLEFVLVTCDSQWRWRGEYTGDTIVDFIGLGGDE